MLVKEVEEGQKKNALLCLLGNIMFENKCICALSSLFIFLGAFEMWISVNSSCESIVWSFSINRSHSVKLYHTALLLPLFGHSQAPNAAIIAYFMPSWYTVFVCAWLRVREARAFSL